MQNYGNPSKTEFKPASPFIPKDQSTPVNQSPGPERPTSAASGGNIMLQSRTATHIPPPLTLPLEATGCGGAPRVGDRKTSTPSCQALRGAVSTLYRIDDFHLEKIGAGFFSEVFKVTHKTSGKIMVLKMNKHRSNRNNMLKEVQLLNKLSHPNILRFEAACVHEGQLHALTEFINYGSLEQLIQKRDEDLPWSVRLSLALDIAKGIAYLHSKGMFHRDLTSKNVLIRRSSSSGLLSAVVADFGLAAKIPNSTDYRLPQVGSPYWMSPECLRGKFYDEKADIFSYGIILCELIGRLDADPDVLPRTENFGVDYIAFSAICPSCPPDFLKLAYSCVRIDPKCRPSAKELIKELESLLESQRRLETRQHFEGKITLRIVGHKRSLTTPEDELIRRSSPSERARFHYRTNLSVMSVGKEMSLRDPHYRPSVHNPFATLPRLREGKKIFGSSHDLFSSCFELPSPARGPTPNGSQSGGVGDPFFLALAAGVFGGGVFKRSSQSLPSSPTSCSRRDSLEDAANLGMEEEHLHNHHRKYAHHVSSTSPESSLRSSVSKFEDHLFQGRVQLLKRLYSGGCTWLTQDDSAVEMSSASGSAATYLLRRRGSCESGFYSVGTTDDLALESGMSSTRSLGSSLLTVSDLEEDLRAASAFLSNQRTSSVFTDSNEDLASFSEAGGDVGNGGNEREYERDIRDIVEYFEASCRRGGGGHKSVIARSGVAPRAAALRAAAPAAALFCWPKDQPVAHRGDLAQLPRSQKIDSLIKRVVEKESRERLRSKAMATSLASASSSQRLQICDGIVRSKLPLFDDTKAPARSRLPYDQKGFVKARLAIFDHPAAAVVLNSSTSGKKMAETRGGHIKEGQPTKLAFGDRQEGDRRRGEDAAAEEVVINAK